ncbi:desmethyl-deoxy-podophyllotoxin synthase-like [Pyrus x bretschneideri]|uniref:desmethyl-deoxy-podophyllotoxin synthase-like n=1 Tax=Pyrus x bretschneideri TaxID=225117 RepID=UPI00203016C4|nr:desmethyl-deoxy-podophyllotoxin synthase-like [Pyrus x bretschneideri]
MMKVIKAYLNQIMFLIVETPYFSFFTSLLLCILVIFWKRSRARGLKLPPGPWKLPIIGNLHQMVGPLPHHTLRDLAKKHGPIMHLKLGQLEAVIISSAKAAREVLKTHELAFAQRPIVLAAEVMSFGQGGIIFAPYGDLWRSLRKICIFELLSAKHVQSFRSVREEEVRNLMESIGSMSHKGLAINFSDRCCSFVNDVVSKAAFGKKCKDQKEFLSLLDESSKLASGFDLPDLFPSLSFLGFITGSIAAMKDVKSKLGTILENIINDHKIKRSKKDLKISNTSTTAGNDKAEEVEEGEEGNFVDVFLKLKESNKAEFSLTTNQIKDVILDIFAAGSETSATTLEWVMSELMRNPRVMKRAQAEVRQLVLQFEGKKSKVIEERDVQKMDYLKLVVKETLRLHSPAPLLPREARDTVQIGGFELPVKSKVIINLWAMGRDPKIWGADAECFKPERFQGSSVDFKGFDFEFTPFGAGRRMCPGMSFGVTMVELALAELLYRFDWKLANGMNPNELDMTEIFGMSCKRKNALYLIATPHFTSVDESE